MATAAITSQDKRGIQYWMERAVKECERVGSKFDTDPVHDLRVALRRCRSMAEGFRAVDPDPTWRKMRKSAKTLFSALGELRDVQVLKDWVDELGAPGDSAKERLLAYCQEREKETKAQAAIALSQFDVRTWLGWAHTLDSRERRVAGHSDIFQVIALEKLEDVLRLYRTAVRNRSKVALHSLRIGIKRFRYVVENFLPEHDVRWSDGLKQVQDCLGEIHDLDVLWTTALRVRGFTSAEERKSWQSAIAQARAQRVAAYRQKFKGRDSLLVEWREGLLCGDSLRRAIQRKFEMWAGYLDPDPSHAGRIAESCRRIYDGLVSCSVTSSASLGEVDIRDLLTISAVIHEVGRAAGRRKRHKRAARMLEKLDVPPGWSAEHLRIIGLAVRYHRGALPFSHPVYARLARSKQRIVALLGGILRLAEAMESTGHEPDRKPVLEKHDGYLVLHAEVQPAERIERIAARRYLLETACGVPIMLSSAASA